MAIVKITSLMEHILMLIGWHAYQPAGIIPHIIRRCKRLPVNFRNQGYKAMYAYFKFLNS